MAWYEPLVDRNLIPDSVLRAAMRRLIAGRLEEGQPFGNVAAYAEHLKSSPIVIHADAANQQHYEVPTEFFDTVLGPHRKYSCCVWELGDTLEQAELRSLNLTAQRAQIEDGHSILDLGCGWGSFSLYAAERFPSSRITAVSNSQTQRFYIQAQAHQRGLTNLRVITANIDSFTPVDGFDRIVSVEMLEHVRNYQALFRRIATWLKPQGRFFVHIFSHHRLAYPFEVRDSSDWMAQHFFTGGQMPSDDLFHHFQDDLRVLDHWTLSGLHYAKTLEAWLARMDQHQAAIMPLFDKTYGSSDALKWWVRWRMFFMASAELWNFGGGKEWIVSHYLFAAIQDPTPLARSVSN